MKLKQLVLNKASNVSKELSTVIERTTLHCDALHPTTPDFGQGGCSALEDSAIIAKCLGEAFIKPITEQENDESMKIRKGLEKYAKERRWRNFTFISAAYLSGFIQESDNKIISFLSQYFLAGVTISVTLRIANFN
ncbi:hypothetical protein EJD97_021396 [Solanum chilense]|uniref:Uncharacterized protein n=1 Tax=Solanum chilense TaxID=4083 RepID=A0A6N2B3B1_SOLCI|nr:hypothetical protein EJD97_021396 [Solanum chilense]